MLACCGKRRGHIAGLDKLPHHFLAVPDRSSEDNRFQTRRVLYPLSHHITDDSQLALLGGSLRPFPLLFSSAPAMSGRRHVITRIGTSTPMRVSSSIVAALTRLLKILPMPFANGVALSPTTDAVVVCT